jgi:hypothetical protein
VPEHGVVVKGLRAMIRRCLRLGTGLCLLISWGCENQGKGAGPDFIDEFCAFHVEAVERLNCPGAPSAETVLRSCEAQQVRVLARCEAELQAFDELVLDEMEKRVSNAIEDANCSSGDETCREGARESAFLEQFGCAFTDESKTTFSGDVALIVSTSTVGGTQSSGGPSTLIGDDTAFTKVSTALAECSAGR